MWLDLPNVLEQLARQRPIFHSEADFQHALAWTIQRAHPDVSVRLETRPERGVRLDLLLRGPTTVAVELKYLVAGVAVTIDGELFNLPNQGAHDISRYDCCKDVARVERFTADGIADEGFVVILSNDSGYWRPGRKASPVDELFRLHEGREIEGELLWAPIAGLGTTRGRTDPLVLRSRYACAWRDYSNVAEGRAGAFRYLLWHVHT